MKTEPTETDREAARLFVAAPGMRIRAKMHNVEDGFWSRASRHSDVGGVFCDAEPTVDECKWVRPLDVAAIDTDDPATVGCMLAQVEQSRPCLAVTIVDRLVTIPGESDRRFAVLVSTMGGMQDVFPGPTRGAALVAAMRALKPAKTQ